MSKNRIRVKITTKCQSKLNRDIRKFNWEIKKSVIKKHNKSNRFKFINPVIEQEIKNWERQFIDKIMYEE